MTTTRVLDADTADAGQVHARLDGDDGAGGERSALGAASDSRGSSWISSPTPWPVPWEKASRPARRRRSTSRQAASTARHVAARPHRGDAGGLGRGDDVEQPLLVGVGIAEADRAGHVGAVAVDLGAEVEDDEVALDDGAPTTGRWWGLAPFGPEATIVSKLGPLAPSRRISVSSSRPNSASVGPSRSRRAEPVEGGAWRWRRPPRSGRSRRRPSTTRSAVDECRRGHELGDEREATSDHGAAARPTVT